MGYHVPPSLQRAGLIHRSNPRQRWRTSLASNRLSRPATARTFPRSHAHGTSRTATALRRSAAQRDQERRTDNRWRLWRVAPGKPLRRGRFDQVTKRRVAPIAVLRDVQANGGHPSPRTDRNLASPTFNLELPSTGEKAVDTEPITEYAEQMSGGGFHVWNTESYIERIYPLALRIKAGQRFGGKVYRRVVVVVEDWSEVPPAGEGCDDAAGSEVAQVRKES